MDMFRDFLANETFIKSLNATFLVLIPKKGVVEDFKDFRPISVLGRFIKNPAGLKRIGNSLLATVLG